MAGDGAVVVAGNKIAGTVGFPVLASYDSHRVLKEAQHPPEACNGSWKNQLTGSGVQFESKGSHVLVTWQFNVEGDCLPNVKETPKNFTTMISAGELKRPMAHLHGHGTVPLALENMVAGIGYKSQGSLHWDATITMKRVTQTAGA